jgi:hypothetical protein
MLIEKPWNIPGQFPAATNRSFIFRSIEKKKRYKAGAGKHRVDPGDYDFIKYTKSVNQNQNGAAAEVAQRKIKNIRVKINSD